VSTVLALVAIGIGSQIFASHEEVIEKYSGLALILFGLLYALYSYKRHSGCGHDHSHHGPDPTRAKTPFLFLFSLGLSPCVAVLPILGVAATQSSFAAVVAVVAFCAGVITALVGATLLVSSGLVKLDHPVLEHYGDVIAGFGIAALGGVLFLL
jgi:cytochrome c biogenesis protein CcdA